MRKRLVALSFCPHILPLPEAMILSIKNGKNDFRLIFLS